MVNLEPEFGNDKKWNEERHYSHHAGTYWFIWTLHYLGSVSSKTNDFKIHQIKKHKLEKWQIGHETAKWLKNDQRWKRTQFHGPRAKGIQIRSYGNLNYGNSNHLRFVPSKKGNNRKNESILEKTNFQLKLVKWSKKNTNSRSDLRKINQW